MKQVVAVEGDVITSNQSGVTVNGKMVADSKPMAADASNRPLKAYKADQYTIPDGEVFVMSDINPQSFDSRYFGTIPVVNIQSIIVPLTIW